MNKKATHNERNAGRKPTYNVPTKLKRVPIIAEGAIDELLQAYLTKQYADQAN